MRIFLFDLLISIMGTIVLWQFGLASKIWPAHPMLATTLIVAACAIATHKILSRDAQSKKPIPPPQG
jgi:hypothetical protein